MSGAADSVLIWKESIYKNGFRCTSCGAALFDVSTNQPTDSLAFESVIPGQPLPARCRCGRCGSPAAAAQLNPDGLLPGLRGRHPGSHSRERIKVKMYAVGISTDEAYEWMTQREEEFEKILKEANVKAVHPDPQGRFQAFLFLHPKARNKAYSILRRHFKTAFIIANPAMADISRTLKET